MNLYFTVFTRTTLPLSVYSHVLGYFWLSTLKPKKQKHKHKKSQKNKKKQKFLI